MNKEIRKIFSRFLMKCVITVCLMCFFAGAVTAKQRSEYNSYFTPYSVLTLKNTQDEINLSIDEKDYTLDLSNLNNLRRYKNYLYFTPFSSFYFFLESIFDFFSDFKG